MRHCAIVTSFFHGTGMLSLRLNDLIAILIIALGYFVVGKWSLLLAIPPGFATPVWPAAGIALAGAMLYGYRCLPGVFLGSFAVNLMVASGHENGLLALQPLLVATGIAIGASMQAAIGYFLVNLHVILPTRLEKERDIFSILLWGGAVAALTNAVLGPLTLYFTGTIPSHALLVSIFTWWVGDAIGIILFAPLLLLLANPSISHLRKVIVTLPILLFSALVVLVFFEVKENAHVKKQQQFNITAQNVSNELEKNIQQYLNVLTAIERYISASEYITYAEFETFTHKFFDLYPGIHALSWNQRVTHAQRPAFEARIRRQGMEDFFIKQRSDAQHISAAPASELYFPVTYITPLSGNEAALGHDTYGRDNVAGTLRRSVLDKAMRGDTAHTTGKIRLVQQRDGMVIYHPVYDNALQQTDAQSRRDHILGFAAGVFLIDEMLAPLQDKASKAGAHLLIRDLSAAPENQWLLDTRPPDEQKTLDSQAVEFTQIITIAGHRWQMQMIKKNNSDLADQGWELWYVLIGGLLLSCLFGTFLLIISAQAEDDTSKLREEAQTKRLLFIPIFSAFITMTLTMGIWSQLREQESDMRHAMVQEEYALISQAIQQNVDHSIFALQRMAKRWEMRGGTPEVEWRADTQNYIQDNKALTTVEWINADYLITWAEPLLGNEKAIGLNIRYNDERQKYLTNAARPGAITLTPPLDLVQGYRAFIVYVPLYPHNRFDGFIAGVYDVNQFLTSIIPPKFNEQFHISILDQSKLVYTNKTLGDDPGIPAPYRHMVKLVDRDWLIELTPKAPFLKNHQSLLPSIIFLSGSLMSLLVGLAIYYAITARQRSVSLYEKAVALADSEAQYRAVVDNAVDGLIIIGAGELIESINPALEEMFGYSREELVGKPVSLLLPTLHETTNTDSMQCYYLIGEESILGISQEMDGQRKGGARFPLEISVSEITLSGKTLFSAVVRDITERKLAQSKLIESERFQQLIKESNPDLIFVKDAHSRIVDANKAFFTLYPANMHDRVIGYTTTENFSSEEAQGFMDQDRQALEKGYSETMETVHMPDGKLRQFHTQKIRFENTRGEIFVLCIARDVTEREELMEKITQSNSELERFAYVASHDMQEPLRMIVNFGEILQREYTDKLDADGKEFLGLVVESGKRMREIISDLLDYSRASNDPKQFQQVNTMQELTHVMDDLRAYTQERGAIITFDELPDINGNPIQFMRLLQNLMVNAMKYQPKGNIPRVHVGIESDGDMWHFTVEDNGLGIEESYIKQVFEPFRRLHSWNEINGTGLGLAVCKKIVENHGGTIWITSTPGQGSIFHFTIPKYDPSGH